MKERIRLVMERTGLSQQDFANRLEISPASLSSIFTGRTNPTNNHVQAIHRAFPEININWLLFAEGEMLDGISSFSESHSPSGYINAHSSSDVNAVTLEASSPSHPDDFVSQNSGTVKGTPLGSMSNKPDLFASRNMSGHMDINCRNYDKTDRKITEIRVFFDDGTYESFLPALSR